MSVSVSVCVVCERKLNERLQINRLISCVTAVVVIFKVVPLNPQEIKLSCVLQKQDALPALFHTNQCLCVC